jgi:hypothetical protein
MHAFMIQELTPTDFFNLPFSSVLAVADNDVMYSTYAQRRQVRLIIVLV